MATFTPVEVSVSAKKLSCVLDVPLALSPNGLLFALRLAHEFNVWLVRSLWQILDSRDFYPDLLLLAHSRGAGQRTLRHRDHQRLSAAIRQWEWARLDSDLAGLNLFWAGDARYESLLPREVDKFLVDRFETFAAELDGRSAAADGRPTPFDPRRECARDAVALAAALVRYRPLIFTLCGNGRGAEPRTDEPPLCEYLRECNIAPHRVASGPLAMAVKRELLPMFARSGVVELLWSGLDLAVIHLVAPSTVVMPAEEPAGNARATSPLMSDHTTGEAVRYLDGASAHWWTME